MATNTSTITILIADDHAVVRMGLSALLNQQKGLKVVGEADDGAAAVKLAGRLKPDVAVLDLMMPVMGGVEATQKIKSVSGETKILLLTSYGTSMDIVRAVTFGASGALLKDTPNDELIAAVREIANGGEYFSRSIRDLLRETPQPPLALRTATAPSRRGDTRLHDRGHRQKLRSFDRYRKAQLPADLRHPRRRQPHRSRRHRAQEASAENLILSTSRKSVTIGWRSETPQASPAGNPQA